jgi:hypothetical protein
VHEGREPSGVAELFRLLTPIQRLRAPAVASLENAPSSFIIDDDELLTNRVIRWRGLVVFGFVPKVLR